MQIISIKIDNITYNLMLLFIFIDESHAFVLYFSNNIPEITPDICTIINGGF